MSEHTSLPWPLIPYKGFSNYGPADRALFAGREKEIVQFAQLLAGPTAQIVVLHGLSGCGKTSFLRAGVIPFLEEGARGFSVPSSDGTLTKSPDTPAHALFVRSTGRPLEQLARSVHEITQQEYRTEGLFASQTLDLRPLVGGLSTEAFAAAVVDSPTRLIEVLESLAAKLPQKLVLVVDQAEEVLTLNETHDPEPQAPAFFAFLDAFSRAGIPLKIIVTLRTEFFGQFRAAVRPAPSAPVQLQDYLLEEPSREVLEKAMLRPTLPDAFTQYGFTFEKDLPNRIVSDLLRAAHRGDLIAGTLPALQVICESLYKKTRTRSERGGTWTIRLDDYEKQPNVESHIEHFVDEILWRFLRPEESHPPTASKEDEQTLQFTAWKDVLAKLARTHPNGTVTTELLTPNELLPHRRSPARIRFDEMLRYLAHDDQGILRAEFSDSGPSTDLGRLRLRHDAIALVLNRWKADRQDRLESLVIDELVKKHMPTVERMEVVYDIDDSGSATQIWRWLGLRQSRAHLDLSIPYKLRVVGPDATVGNSVVRALTTEGRTSPNVSFRVGSRKPGTVSGDIVIESPAVSFEAEQRLLQAFCPTRAAMKAAFEDEEWKEEYVGFFVDMPIESLSMSIVFPAAFSNMKPEPRPVVFLGTGEKPHPSETQRCLTDFTFENNRATLGVEKPRLGLTYAISWTPPS